MHPALIDRRRVLMTTDTLTGVWEHALELARGLVRCGMAPTLAVLGGPLSGAHRTAAAAVPGLTLHEGPFRPDWVPGCPPDRGCDRIRQAGDWLLALERRLAPDLIHLNHPIHAVLPWRAPVLAAVHGCAVAWRQGVGQRARADDPCAALAWQDHRERLAAGLRAAGRVVAPSRTLLAHLHRLHGPLPAALVIGPGRDPVQYRPRVKENTVIGAGRLWDPGVNVAALDAVAPWLDWPVVVAGGWQRPDGQGASPENASPENAQCLGIVPSAELAAWFSRAAIFVRPARYTGDGLTVLEAAQSGCALVLGDLPALRETWQGVAVFVPPDDHDTLRRVLATLIAAPEHCRRLGLAARRRGGGWTAERMVQAYRAAYDGLLAVSRPAAAGRRQGGGSP